MADGSSNVCVICISRQFAVGSKQEQKHRAFPLPTAYCKLPTDVRSATATGAAAAITTIAAGATFELVHDILLRSKHDSFRVFKSGDARGAKTLHLGTHHESRPSP